jgi:hypothetical protein
VIAAQKPLTFIHIKIYLFLPCSPFSVASEAQKQKDIYCLQCRGRRFFFRGHQQTMACNSCFTAPKIIPGYPQCDMRTLKTFGERIHQRIVYLPEMCVINMKVSLVQYLFRIRFVGDIKKITDKQLFSVENKRFVLPSLSHFLASVCKKRSLL